MRESAENTSQPSKRLPTPDPYCHCKQKKEKKSRTGLDGHYIWIYG